MRRLLGFIAIVVHVVSCVSVSAKCQAGTGAMPPGTRYSATRPVAQGPEPRTARRHSEAEKRERESAIATLKSTESTVVQRLNALHSVLSFRWRDLGSLVADVAKQDSSEKVRQYADMLLKRWEKEDAADLAESKRSQDRERLDMKPSDRRAKEKALQRAAALKNREHYLGVLRTGGLEERREVTAAAVVWAEYVPEAMPLLRDIAANDKDYVLRVRALAALGRHDGDGGLPVFRACAARGNEAGIRQQAARYLVSRGHKEGVDVLIDLLNSERARSDQWFGVTVNAYLEKFTKRKSGYPSCHPNPAQRKGFTEQERQERDKAVEAWQAWWNEAKESFVVPVQQAAATRSTERRP